ncbi:hypothetical protein CVT24_000579 [Panaeolus cyanescens]|uniref:G domain-containing protein n=1 Tax=Panaeolus cyanescens TaxID=181874 RepID=A0A409YDH6_9AGAR|nr:hypothetical protein CVT24_000579 [Panaeolus cyanescens]
MTSSNLPHLLSKFSSAMGFFDNLASLLGLRQIKSTDLVILVIGPSGVGKSSFINKFAGQNILKVGHGLETTTRKFSHVLCPSRTEQRIVLVDTPPFPLSMQDEVRIKKWMRKSLGKNMIFHSILYLHRITDNRLNEPPKVHFHTFETLAGGEFHSRVALVTTMWDTLRNQEVGKGREKEIMTGDWEELTRKGSLVLRHENSTDSAAEIIEQVISLGRVSSYGTRS